MNDTPSTSDDRALVPTRQQLAFSRLYTDDGAQRQAGTLIFAILLVGVLAWGVTAPIADPVVTTTVVTLDAERKTVTHPRGGIVSERLAKHGDNVDRGQAVLRLDSAAIAAQQELVWRERRDTLALQSHLLSAQQAAESPAIDGGPESTTYRRQAELLAAKTAGLERQLDAQTRLKTLYEAEREELALSAAPAGEQQPSLRDAEQRLARQDALLAELAAHLASSRLEQLAAESDERQRRQTEQQLAQVALQGARQKLLLLDRRQQALDEAMQATVMRAPVAGRVELAPTIEQGTPIAPGETVFSIRPPPGDLIATAQIPRPAAQRVKTGRTVSIRLTAGTTGERLRLRGRVSEVTPSTDDATQRVTVRIPVQLQRPWSVSSDTTPVRYPAEVAFDGGERTPIRRLLDALERWRAARP